MLKGHGGRDRLVGGIELDLLQGGAGDDRLVGGGGGDILEGGAGDDVLSAGKQNDRLVGGDGADRLAGGRQDDRLEGGAGADVFRFVPGDDADRVDDWTPGEDRIDLRAFDFAGRGEVLALAEQAGDDVVIDLGAWEATITLRDADLDDLGRGDLIL